MIEMIELIDKGYKTIFINIFQRIKVKMNVMKKVFLKNQVDLVDIFISTITQMSEMKILLERLNNTVIAEGSHT